MRRGDETLVILLLAGRLLLNSRVFESDTLNNSDAKDILLVPIVDLVLGRRAAAVKCQYDHYLILLKNDIHGMYIARSEKSTYPELAKNGGWGVYRA